MAELDIAQTTTSDLTTAVTDFSVNSVALDHSGENEYRQYYEESTKNIGYYKQIPELKTAIDALAIWTDGKGYETEDDLP